MLLDLLDEKDRTELARNTREQVRLENLKAAIGTIEQYIEHSSDEPLIKAAQASALADLDWADVVAESVEADAALKSIGEEGCRYVELEIGCLSDRRLDIFTNYFAASPVRVGDDRAKRAAVGGYHLDEPPLRLVGAEALAQLQRAGISLGWSTEQLESYRRREMLAGHLLVLRFLDVAQRYAVTLGFPFVTQLKLCVERVGGEAAIGSLDPYLEMTVTPAVAPITGLTEDRLAERSSMHIAKWHEQTSKLIATMQRDYAERGYIPCQLIPEEMEEAARLRRLEEALLVYEPAHRMTPCEASSLIAKVREVRERHTPQTIDMNPYRELR